jgi:hypothetical protein
MRSDLSCSVESVLQQLLDGLRESNRRLEISLAQKDKETGKKSYVMHDNTWYGTSWFSNWARL